MKMLFKNIYINIVASFKDDSLDVDSLLNCVPWNDSWKHFVTFFGQTLCFFFFHVSQCWETRIPCVNVFFFSLFSSFNTLKIHRMVSNGATNRWQTTRHQNTWSIRRKKIKIKIKTKMNKIKKNSCAYNENLLHSHTKIHHLWLTARWLRVLALRSTHNLFFNLFFFFFHGLFSSLSSLTCANGISKMNWTIFARQ